MVSGLLTSAPFLNRRHPQLQRATEYSLSGRNPGCVEIASNRAEFRADTARHCQIQAFSEEIRARAVVQRIQTEHGRKIVSMQKGRSSTILLGGSRAYHPDERGPSGPLRHRTESGGRGRRRQGYFCKQVLRTTDGLAWRGKRSCDAQCCYASAAAASAVASTV